MKSATGPSTLHRPSRDPSDRPSICLATIQQHLAADPNAGPDPEIRIPQFDLGNARRRTGKIARLPAHRRETINLMLRDGLTYAAIIEKLGAPGKHLNYHNLKRWRQGGYQDWLKALQRREYARIRQQFAEKLIAQTEPADLPSKTAQTLALRFLDVLLDFDREACLQQLATDPSAFIRLLNTLLKLCAAHPLCEPPSPLTQSPVTHHSTPCVIALNRTKSRPWEPMSA